MRCGVVCTCRSNCTCSRSRVQFCTVGVLLLDSTGLLLLRNIADRTKTKLLLLLLLLLVVRAESFFHRSFPFYRIIETENKNTHPTGGDFPFSVNSTTTKTRGPHKPTQFHLPSRPCFAQPSAPALAGCIERTKASRQHWNA